MLVLVACCVTSVHYTSREAPLLFSRGGIRACPFSLRDFDKLRCMQAESLTYFLMSEQYKCIQWVAFGARGFPPSPPPLVHTDTVLHTHALQDGPLSREFICFLYASLM